MARFSEKCDVVSGDRVYITTGAVLGYLWMGGEGWYPTTEISGTTIKEVKQKAEKMLEDGSLDSGMGFQGLKGAIMDIAEDVKMEINGKEYSAKRGVEKLVVGKLSAEEEEEGERVNYNYHV